MVKSAKFQMTIHIDYDREENKIQFLMASQTKMIRTLAWNKILGYFEKESRYIYIWRVHAHYIITYHFMEFNFLS